MYDGEDAPEDEHEAEERVFFLFFFIDHSDPSFLYEESDGLQWAGTTLPTAAPKRGHYVAWAHEFKNTFKLQTKSH